MGRICHENEEIVNWKKYGILADRLQAARRGAARCGDASSGVAIHSERTRRKRHTTSGKQSRADARPAQSSAAQTKDDGR
ncbi:uncharacterized protein DS421_19g647920 [Arachis hypogaea]|uniref:Uncharacterized protein n=1 Tax=Arachis hypogaea TaxID=3818 RepID=A0A6B9V5P1_ARAHY|nr:uncharacterized protein DS421_19g647920 [Arachis hypogaea]